MAYRRPDEPRWRRTARVALRPALALVCAVAGLAGCSQTPPPSNRDLSWHPSRLDVARPSAPAPHPTAPIPPASVYQTARTTPKAAPGLVPRPLAAATVPKVRGVYKVGKPYQIAGVTYVPAVDPGYDRTGIASWYGDAFHAKRTANGEVFDKHALTAAHPTLPMPSYLYVTNLRNGRTILVRLNDRGPYKKGRIIDLSYASAKALGYDLVGLTEVRVRYAGPAPLDPADDSREQRFLAAQARPGPTPPGPPFGLGIGVRTSQR